MTVRLDPKLKYLAELAARRQRRPLSSFIEWAIEQSLSQVSPSYEPVYDPFDNEKPISFKDISSDLWDVDEPDRFAKLAFRYPDLLDHEEQRLWKHIRECGLLWRGGYSGPNNEWDWRKEDEGSLILERLREHWDTFKRVAGGDLDPSSLPKWKKYEPESSGENGLDDEIPF